MPKTLNEIDDIDWESLKGAKGDTGEKGETGGVGGDATYGDFNPTTANCFVRHKHVAQVGQVVAATLYLGLTSTASETFITDRDDVYLGELTGIDALPVGSEGLTYNHHIVCHYNYQYGYTAPATPNPAQLFGGNASAYIDQDLSNGIRLKRQHYDDAVLPLNTPDQLVFVNITIAYGV
jgi:hypothetical protein